MLLLYTIYACTYFDIFGLELVCFFLISYDTHITHVTPMCMYMIIMLICLYKESEISKLGRKEIRSRPKLLK